MPGCTRTGALGRRSLLALHEAGGAALQATEGDFRGHLALDLAVGIAHLARHRNTALARGQLDLAG